MLPGKLVQTSHRAFSYTNRFEPPVESKPEAANFPSEQYSFSESHELFKAPHAYPEPPTDMWYTVPEDKPKPAEPPKPIFPWERERDRPKPTRVFAEDLPPPEPTPLTPTITLSPSSAPGPPGAHPFSTVHYEQDETMSEEVAAPGQSPERVSSPKTADQQWQDFQQNTTNAWDTVPGIETYVRAIMESHTRKGKAQVQHQATSAPEVMSPVMSRKNRRESLILTDFPTAVERPSLPVTPAPVRRPMFWGEERDSQGELPQAEGVPDQQDWVCPQCGFSSISASDFLPRRILPTSSISLGTATAPTLQPVITQTIEIQPVSIEQVEEEQKTSAAEPTSSTTDHLSPKATSKTTLKATPTLTPPKPNPRDGLNDRGTPLASLTDPTLLDTQQLLDTQPQAPGIDPTSSASIVSSVTAA